ncbi:uncharacterized protein [Amphiura filiformis]|uniref:uncharacterized protein n=1 Tax=Amphiura filiformis TaxID=82378 RepID=UPI003B21EFB5
MSKTRATKKKEKEKHPGYLDTRDIVFSNLLLLGFEPGDMESKYNIPFTKDMFALPNKKAFEVIMNFLFGKLNPVMAAEKFRFCWPITDKKQEQVFRRTVSDWLQEISKEDPDAHLPRIVPSLFLSPGGDKFYTVLLYFTQYVVYKAIRGENGEKEREILKKPQLAPGLSPLSSVMLKTYQAATIRRQKRFLEQTQVTVLVHKQWQEFVSELVKDYRALSKTVRELERKVKDLNAKSYDQAQTRGEVMSSRRRSGVRSDGEKKLLAVKRAEKLRKVRELWKAVDGLMEAQAPEREVVESILQEVAMKSKLDANDFHVQVPELLLRECEAEIQRRSIANVYQGGKLSLLSLIQLWNLALKLYLEKIHQAPLASFDTIAPSVVTQVHTHHAHLSNAQALRTNLAKDVDELKTSIHQLRHQTSMKTPGRSQGSLRSFQTSTFGLGLLPPTPPVSFEPANSNDNTPMRLHGMRASTEQYPTIDTPEAVSRMSQAVDKAALRTSGLVQGTPSSMLKDLRQQIHGTSKLPVPTVDNTTSLQNRRRIQSAPSKVTSTAPPTTPFHPRSKPAAGLSQRKQVTKVSRTERKHNDKGIGVSRVEVSHQGKGTHDGRRHGRTPVVKQTNNNASSRCKQKSKAKATPKAHQILVDQIADAVMSGDGFVDSISPLLLQSSNSHESPPVTDSLKNPVAALGNAFVSRDKLARTPTHSASPAVSSSMRSNLLQQATRNLFVTPPSNTQHEIPARIQNEFTETTDTLSSPHSQRQTFADKTEDDVRLRATPSGVPTQRTTQGDISISHLMDFSNTSLLLQDTLLSDDSSDDILRRRSDEQLTVETDEQSSLTMSQHQYRTQQYRLSPPDLQSPVSDRTHESKTFQNAHIPSTPGYKDRDSVTPTDLPLEDLEQTLLEITRTKTPQLPTRARQRTNHQRVMAPLQEDVEDDLITSTTRLSLSPLMNTDFEKSPAFRDSTRSQWVDNVVRTESDQVFETRTGGNVLNELSEWNAAQNGQHTKTRPQSNGSQKSVTFSDHVDQHSFLDLSNVSKESHEESETGHEDDDADFGIIDVHNRQAYEYIEVKTPESNIITAKQNTDGSPPADNNDSFFSETYLRHSPRSKDGKESAHTPLDSVLQSALNFSEVHSPDPAQRMKLLEHISPTITPSKTPKLATRKGVLSQGHLVSSSTSSRSQDYVPSRSSFNGFDQSSGYSETPPVEDDDSLVLGLSNMKLSGSSYRHTGDRQTAQEKVHHTPRANLEFSGLFDEDDSILLSGSPLSRSLHQDGMDHLNVSSPPVQNLIDI